MRKTNLPSQAVEKMSATLRLLFKNGKILVAMAVFGLFSLALDAQDYPDCSCNDLLNVSLDSDGQAVITPWLILEGNGSGNNCVVTNIPGTANQYKFVVLKNPHTGETINPESYDPDETSGNNPTTANDVIVNCENLGEWYVEVWIDPNVTGATTNLPTSAARMTCWGTINLEDKLPPTLTCLPDDVTIGCIFDKNPMDPANSIRTATFSWDGDGPDLFGGTATVPDDVDVDVTIDLPKNAIVKDVNVMFSVTHHHAENVRVRLEGPPTAPFYGVTDRLLFQSSETLGDNCERPDLALTIDDDASLIRPICNSASPAHSGSVQSNGQNLDGNLEGVFGFNLNGDWTLTFVETENSDDLVGKVTKAQIIVTYALAPLHTKKIYWNMGDMLGEQGDPVPNCPTGDFTGMVTPMTGALADDDSEDFVFDLSTLPPSTIITDVNISVDAKVEKVGDLRVRLQNPESGMFVTIHDEDDPCSVANVDAVFDDEGSDYTCNAASPGISGNTEGNFTPINPLTFMPGFGFNDVHPLTAFECNVDPAGVTVPINGDWTVRLRDANGNGKVIKGVNNVCIKIAYFIPELVPPIGDDNCEDDLTISYTDAGNPTCGVGTIRRTWKVTDPNGNTATHVQNIRCIKDGTTADDPQDDTDSFRPLPIFPADLTLKCDATGSPFDPEMDFRPSELEANHNTATKFFDEPRFHHPDQMHCSDLATSYDDILLDECLPYAFTIRRSWKIYDWCDDKDPIYRCYQTIRVVDDEAPEIDCSSQPITRIADYDCIVSISDLDFPEVTDNCATVAWIDKSFHVVRTTDGAIFSGTQLDSLMKGEYSIIYKAEDPCGNFSTCSQPLSILDLTPPNVICDANTTIALGITGEAWICWPTFDDGTYDNCQANITEIPDILQPDFDIHGVTYRDMIFNVEYANASEDPDAAADAVRFDQTTNDGCITISCNGPSNFDVILRVWDDCDDDGVGDNVNECTINVTVQDVVPPQVVCPPNITILCTDDEADFNLTGNASAFDSNCDNVGLTHVDDPQLTTCGIGAINRTFTATDNAGNTATCTQVITIVFNVSERPEPVFPDDVTIENCAAMGELTPANLGITEAGDISFTPANNDYCGTLGSTFEDTVFDLCGAGNTNGFKIRRKWLVSDWCDPAFEKVHYQEIVVNDIQKPTFTTATANNTTISGNDCEASVLFTVSATDNCATAPAITSDATGLTNNMDGTWTGIFPSGTHTVTFEARDVCNNFRTQDVTFTVEDDKDPQANCISSINIQFKQNGVAEVTPKMLNANSTDNCTDKVNLQYFIQDMDKTIDDNGTPGDSSDDFISGYTLSGDREPISVLLDCNDGIFQPHRVTLWVIDEAGNEASCTVDLFLTDHPDNPCPLFQPTASVAGVLYDGADQMVSEATVTIDVPGMPTVTTDNDGSFMFADLPTGADYKVSVEKDIKPLNGVSTWDIVLIRKHILNVEAFDSPYKHIAADINHDEKVSTFDILQLRQVILGQQATFPNNTSWRFVDAAYQFRDVYNPLTDDFPEFIMNEGLASDNMNNDFMSVKVGDVSGDAKPNEFAAGSPRNLTGNLSLAMNDVSMKAGEQYRIPVLAQDFNAVNGMQFTLDLLTSAISFNSIEAAAINVSDANVATNFLDSGLLPLSWDNDEALTIKDGEVLFYLTVTANENIALSTALSVGSRLVASEAYMLSGDNMQRYDVNLRFRIDGGDIVKAEEFTLYQNRPNPFNESTTVGFFLPQTGKASLTIFDVSGKEIKNFEGDYNKGYNEVDVNASDLVSGNIYYYQLKTENNTATKKMVLLQ